jgi:NitT/TauT family transport system substrate-binding protein
MKFFTLGRSIVARSLIATAAIAALGIAPADAQTAAPVNVSMILNWIAGGDHAPYYYAQKMGWYKDAGINLTLEQGKGSVLAAQRVGAGIDTIGLADMATVMQAKGKGAPEPAVMAVYANFPEGFYFLKSSGIKSIKDIEGKKVGNPPADAGRALWIALAKINNLSPDGVTWVNVQPNAKLDALDSKSVDAVTEFYNFHHNYVKALGADFGYLAWKDFGMNPYGNSIVVNNDFLKANPDVIKKFVGVTQRAFAFCAATPAPCIHALVDANSGLDYDNELQNWYEVATLMTDPDFKSTALGWFNPGRMQSTYDIYSGAFKFDAPFAVGSIYTNQFIDKSYKLPAVLGK